MTSLFYYLSIQRQGSGERGYFHALGRNHIQTSHIILINKSAATASTAVVAIAVVQSVIKANDGMERNELKKNTSSSYYHEKQYRIEDSLLLYHAPVVVIVVVDCCNPSFFHESFPRTVPTQPIALKGCLTPRPHQSNIKGCSISHNARGSELFVYCKCTHNISRYGAMTQQIRISLEPQELGSDVSNGREVGISVGWIGG